MVGEAAKAEAEAIEALPKVEEAAVPRPRRRRQSFEDSEGYAPRLKGDYEQRIVKAMTEKFGYKNRLEVPRLDKIVINMGVGEATQDKKKVETGRRRNGNDRRPEAGDHQGEEVDRPVQAARRHADRLQGHPAPRPHVRVPRPARDDRAAARPRFPRAQRQVVRRPRQLRHGPEGTDRVPRDQL